MEMNVEIGNVEDNNQSQIIITDESGLWNEQMHFLSDYENDKNWEEYFHYVEEKIKNATNDDDDNHSPSN